MKLTKWEKKLYACSLCGELAPVRETQDLPQGQHAFCTDCAFEVLGECLRNQTAEQRRDIITTVRDHDKSS